MECSTPDWKLPFCLQPESCFHIWNEWMKLVCSNCSRVHCVFSVSLSSWKRRFRWMWWNSRAGESRKQSTIKYDEFCRIYRRDMYYTGIHWILVYTKLRLVGLMYVTKCYVLLPTGHALHTQDICYTISYTYTLEVTYFVACLSCHCSMYDSTWK